MANINKCQNLQHALLLETSSDNSSMLTLDRSVAFEQPHDEALGLLLIALVLLFIMEKKCFIVSVLNALLEELDSTFMADGGQKRWFGKPVC